MHLCNLWKIRFFLAFTLCLAFLSWNSVRTVQADWPNVPPPASKAQNIVLALGDAQLAYRAQSIMLQNLGEHGGRSHSLDEYNYVFLRGWFDSLSSLDPVSDFIPVLAGYYFGAVQEPDRLRTVIDFLRQVGQNPEGRKWRWLAQAVFLARYDLKDFDLALEIANELAVFPRDDLPGWTKQMPVLIMSDMGRREAAIAMILELIRDHGQDMHPNEVNLMKIHLCDRLIEPEELSLYPFCDSGGPM